MEVSTSIKWPLFGFFWWETILNSFLKPLFAWGEHRLGNRRIQHLELSKFRLASSQYKLDFLLTLLSTGFITLWC